MRVVFLPGESFIFAETINEERRRRRKIESNAIQLAHENNRLIDDTFSSQVSVIKAH